MERNRNHNVTKLDAFHERASGPLQVLLQQFGKGLLQGFMLELLLGQGLLQGFMLGLLLGQGLLQGFMLGLLLGLVQGCLLRLGHGIQQRLGLPPPYDEMKSRRHLGRKNLEKHHQPMSSFRRYSNLTWPRGFVKISAQF